MPERLTTREQWGEIAATFARILSARGIPFSDACIEMGFPKNQYHRMHRCLQGPTKARPHTQKIINVIQKWNETYRGVAKQKETHKAGRDRIGVGNRNDLDRREGVTPSSPTEFLAPRTARKRDGNNDQQRAGRTVGKPLKT